MQAKLPVSPERRRDKLVGLLIIVLSFGGCMALSLWGMSVSTPTLAPDPHPPSMEDIPGFPKQVDPLHLVERARSLSVRSKFRGFVAVGVGPDGTIDLSSKKSEIRYSFQSPSGMGHQPPRAGGTLPMRRYCGLQSVYIKGDGIYATKDQPERTCPQDVPENITLPKECTLEEVWKIAEKRKIKGKGVATIEFFDSFDGPAFRFKKARQSFVVSAHDCKKILNGKAARGVVP